VNTEFKYLVFNRLYVFQPMRSFSCFKERLFLFLGVFSFQLAVYSVQLAVIGDQYSVNSLRLMVIL